MSNDTLYFYVDGSDLHDVAPVLRQRLTDFLGARAWVAADAWLVDQVHDDEGNSSPGDLPDWDLGLNLRFESPPEVRPATWFDDVAAVVEFLRMLSIDTGRAFAVGASFDDSPVAEDLFYVEAGPIDLEQMRKHLGG